MLPAPVGTDHRRVDRHPGRADRTGRLPPVPLTNRARRIARQFAEGKSPGGYKFTPESGSQLRAKQYRRVIGWSETAPDKIVHMLRHYRTSEWLRAGIPVTQGAEWLGDDPRTVLNVYAHVLGERQTIEALHR